MQILIYGYGNPGRQDDGLGIEFTRRMEEWARARDLEGYEFENNYQLNIEDAELISRKDLVIFADASEEKIDDFCISRVDGSAKITFTTHAASPGYIVNLCKDLFDKKPVVLLLHIKGYQWEFREGISRKAMSNLEKVLVYMKQKLENPSQLIKSTEGLKLCDNNI